MRLPSEPRPPARSWQPRVPRLAAWHCAGSVCPAHHWGSMSLAFGKRIWQLSRLRVSKLKSFFIKNKGPKWKTFYLWREIQWEQTKLQPGNYVPWVSVQPLRKVGAGVLLILMGVAGLKKVMPAWWLGMWLHHISYRKYAKWVLELASHGHCKKKK